MTERHGPKFESKVSIWSQLVQRDRVQSEYFSNVFSQYGKSLQMAEELRVKFQEIQKENAGLKTKNQELNETMNNFKTQFGGNDGDVDVSSSLLVLNEEIGKLRTQVSDITESRDLFQEQLERSLETVRDREVELVEKKQQVTSLENRLKATQGEVETLQGKLEEKEVTLEILRDELQAIQTEHREWEVQMSTMRAENKEIVRRWLEKMNAVRKEMERERERERGREGVRDWSLLTDQFLMLL
eukprot:TRINITY_DN3681_c0_g1_i5.p1 TRINITY_DN3681_c0_g1~~TRINITY_DN3681_c0_g1_i5.p1  ORF type:complete len:243 (-),score=59.87 TRINITY_DN3681_c0_g1_i5:353-1081(-)